MKAKFKQMMMSSLLTLSLSSQALAQNGSSTTSGNTTTPGTSKPLLIEGFIPMESTETIGLQKVFVFIQNGKIQQIRSKESEILSLPTDTLRLTERETGQKWLLSPGFIDMHNHLDHNVLPLWKTAKGQFNNRFDWRADLDYKKNVRGLVQAVKESSASSGSNSNFCKIIQYAEIKALVGGVTSIQGIGGAANNECVKDMLVRNIEHKSDYEVQTDARVSFEVINPKHAAILDAHVIPTMKEDDLDLLDAYNSLPTEIKKDTAYSYTDAFFAGIDKLLQIFENVIPNGTKSVRAFITHVAEGKSNDPFTKIEFKIADAIGYARHGMVLIHGIGLNEEDWSRAAEEKISLVWSPFSNLLLYGETTDVASAKKVGINITLGSDWSPSGSKTLLDEVQIAKRYLRSIGKSNLFTDKDYFEMMTINAAKALKLDDRLGELKEGKLADIVAFALPNRITSRFNPFSYIVNSSSDRIRLVVVNGQIAIAPEKVLEATDRVEKLVENSTTNCKGLVDQVLVNAKVSLQEIVQTLTPLFKVDGEVIFDDYLTCRDQKYKDAIAQLFAETFNPEKIGQITLPTGAPTFESLIPQLKLIQNDGLGK